MGAPEIIHSFNLKRAVREVNVMPSSDNQRCPAAADWSSIRQSDQGHCMMGLPVGARVAVNDEFVGTTGSRFNRVLEVTARPLA